LDIAVARILSERLREGRGVGDMLDLLIAARDDDGVGLTPQEIRDEIVTFIVAGHETVASALAWAWLFLARHPEMQDQIAEESRAAHPWSRASIARVPFTRAVFDETMRLYPPAWVITRRSRDADVLPCEISIPAGALLIISPYLLHRHPDIWVDAEEFRPGRFLEPFERDAFIPFGAGPRLCIGRDFAYVEGVLMLAMLTHRFRVTPMSEGMPWADPQVTIRPHGGAPVRLAPR
jgi:cytochrome P450